MQKPDTLMQDLRTAFASQKDHPGVVRMMRILGSAPSEPLNARAFLREAVRHALTADGGKDKLPQIFHDADVFSPNATSVHLIAEATRLFARAGLGSCAEEGADAVGRIGDDRDDELRTEVGTVLNQARSARDADSAAATDGPRAASAPSSGAKDKPHRLGAPGEFD